MSSCLFYLKFRRRKKEEGKEGKEWEEEKEGEKEGGKKEKNNPRLLKVLTNLKHTTNQRHN